MTPDQKAAAKRLNEQFKAASSFLYNASLACFVAGFGLWYSDNADPYWIVAGALGGIVFGGFAIGILQEMRSEE
ncbi:hypothetical protein [Sphingobium sp.]|uniref:hypothetical protein n=1 Tax=Sphingobium sp. TaxID=1912891 RepID=UPI002C28D0ED|nr:hypothetical protein [Sphingobium sp.]HUD91235.1 hypothetical protein [Sphingobium sp.]